MKQVLIIRNSENVVEIDRVPFERGTLDYYYKELECSCIDIVHAYGLSIDADIIVDDEALLKDKPIINPQASIAYGVLKHGQLIMGNAIICKPHFTPDGVDETGFEPEELDKILDEINKGMVEVMKL